MRAGAVAVDNGLERLDDSLSVLTPIRRLGHCNVTGLTTPIR